MTNSKRPIIKMTRLYADVFNFWTNFKTIMKLIYQKSPFLTIAIIHRASFASRWARRKARPTANYLSVNFGFGKSGCPQNIECKLYILTSLGRHTKPAGFVRRSSLVKIIPRTNQQHYLI